MPIQLSEEGEKNKARGIRVLTKGGTFNTTFYFFDETWEKDNAIGPFYSAYEAYKGLKMYKDFLSEGGDESESTS